MGCQFARQTLEFPQLQTVAKSTDPQGTAREKDAQAHAVTDHGRKRRKRCRSSHVAECEYLRGTEHCENPRNREIGPITPQGLVQNHTVKQFVGVHTPKSVKIPVHPNMKDVEIVEVGKITPHERVQNRTMETVDCVDVTMPPGMKQTVDITVSVRGRCGHRGGGAKHTTRSMKNRVEKSSIACSLCGGPTSSMKVDTCDQLRSMHLACFRAVHSVEATEAEVVIEGNGDSSQSWQRSGPFIPCPRKSDGELSGTLLVLFRLSLRAFFLSFNL